MSTSTPPGDPTAPLLDPAVVASVSARAARWIRDTALRYRNYEHKLVADLEGLALEATEAVEHRGRLGTSSFYRGPNQALPSWWRDEYRNDPLLHAIASVGMPASRALPEVVAALWSLRGVVMGLAERAPLPWVVSPGPAPAMAAKLAGVEAEVARLRTMLASVEPLRAAAAQAIHDAHLAGGSFTVPEATMVVLADALRGVPPVDGGPTLAAFVEKMSAHSAIDTIRLDAAGHLVEVTMTNMANLVSNWHEGAAGVSIDWGAVESNPRSGRNLKRVLENEGEAGVRGVLGL